LLRNTEPHNPQAVFLAERQKRPGDPAQAGTPQKEKLSEKQKRPIFIQEESKEAPVNHGEEAVSWDEALARVEGDRELLAEMAALFLDSGPGLLAAVREAIDRQDASGLEHAAHDLKSSVGNFGARKAQEAALKLEKMGRGGDLTHAEEAYRSLERSMRQLWPVLEAMQRSEQAS